MKEFVTTGLVLLLMVIIGVIWYEEGYEDGKHDVLKEINELPSPSAMDVYQGKTTLQYTIVDGQKIDSMVVFKN